LYRALTGRAPFAKAEDDRREAPPLASARNSAVSTSWDVFLAKALHPDPAQRFADASVMDAALPPLAPGAALPPAASLGGESSAGALVSATTRYGKGALVHRDV